MDTREKILACAEELFRQKGYNGVSLREIAEAAEIRVGNLTYHYPRKELLVEAIFFRRYGNIETPERLENAAAFEAYFRHLLDVQRRSAFYFDSYVQLSQTSELIGRFQRERIARLRALFEDGLRLMAEAGEIPPEDRPGAFADRAENILTVLMLRLPGEERQFAPAAQDDNVLRRARALLGIPDA